jgi:hypothetical protein
MSLCFESLAIGICDCGENKQARAKCILSHLSMPVPRSWWEHALKTGQVDETHASVLRQSLAAVSNAVGEADPLCRGLNRQNSLKPFLCQCTIVSGLAIIAD